MEEKKVNCFDSMTTEEMDAWADKIAERAVKKTLSSMGIDDPEDGPSLKELIVMLKNWKAAKKATASAVRSFAKTTFINFFKNLSQIGVILFFIYLMTRYGVDKDKINTVSNFLNVRPPQ